MSEVLWTELEKIDVLRERMGLGYEEARNSLHLAQGDIVKALADLEKAKHNDRDERRQRGREFLGGIQEKIGDLNHTKINLKHNNKTLFSVSAPLGLGLTLALMRLRPSLRLLGLVSVVGAVLAHCKLEVDNSAKSTDKGDPREAIYSQTEMGI
ncbi:MAG: DUF4342 domain-containing protein [Desulfitobacteriaceae bacterium]